MNKAKSTFLLECLYSYSYLFDGKLLKQRFTMSDLQSLYEILNLNSGLPVDSKKVCYNTLPIELKYLIWEAVLDTTWPQITPRPVEDFPRVVLPRREVPTILHVYSISRYIALTTRFGKYSNIRQFMLTGASIPGDVQPCCPNWNLEGHSGCPKMMQFNN